MPTTESIRLLVADRIRREGLVATAAALGLSKEVTARIAAGATVRNVTFRAAAAALGVYGSPMAITAREGFTA